MPSLRQIEYLVALDDARHFRKAAEKVGVSQPTLSAQLRALEQRLGVQLVERSRSSVLLTPVGRQVLAAGRRILRDVQEIRDLAAGQRGTLGGTIRIGLPPTIGPYLLPRMVPELHRKYPDLKLYVREEIPNALPGALADGVHDVILIALPLRRDDFNCVAMFREPLFVVVPEDHALAAKGFVERSDLNGEAVLALERGHQLHEQVEAICDDFGARLLFDYEGTSLDTLRQMIAMGMGLSFLPGLFVETSLGRGTGVVALELKDRSLYRTIGMAWRRTSARENEYQALLGYVRAAVEREFTHAELL
ncbi:MAG: LysR substrate-binding domain-containing protein [Methyloligellaceae bacterium]